jgi:hypothetical protein
MSTCILISTLLPGVMVVLHWADATHGRKVPGRKAPARDASQRPPRSATGNADPLAALAAFDAVVGETFVDRGTSPFSSAKQARFLLRTSESAR